MEDCALMVATRRYVVDCAPIMTKVGRSRCTPFMQIFQYNSTDIWQSKEPKTVFDHKGVTAEHWMLTCEVSSFVRPHDR
jgi:hypothetical protein